MVNDKTDLKNDVTLINSYYTQTREGQNDSNAAFDIHILPQQHSLNDIKWSCFFSILQIDAIRGGIL